MARKITIVLTGDSALNAKLNELTSKQAKEAIRKAARPALQGTLAAARSLAPKRTGRMAKNIKIRAIKRSRSRVGMRVTLSKEGDYTGKAFYGAFNNYGWKTGSRRRPASKRKPEERRQIEGTRFLNKAAEQTRNSAIKIYREGIRAYILNVTTKQ
jgi:HK97 gp10 family phage protein